MGVALRQLFNGGLLGQLAAPATDGGTNIMEDMAMNLVQQQIEQMMASIMSEEEMAQMEQAWNDWEAQMEAEWQANGGLMGMMGMTGEDLQKMMQMMEMKAHCQCTASDVAYGQMAMPTMTAAGRK